MTEPAHRIRDGVKAWSLRRWATLTAIFARHPDRRRDRRRRHRHLSTGQGPQQCGRPARSGAPGPAAAHQRAGERGDRRPGLRAVRSRRLPRPVPTGVDEEHAAAADLRTALGDRFPAATADLNDVVAAADRWRSEFAVPTIDAVRTSRRALSSADIDRVRRSSTRSGPTFVPLNHELQRQQVLGRRTLDRSANALTWTAIAHRAGAAGRDGGADLGSDPRRDPSDRPDRLRRAQGRRRRFRRTR